MHSVCWPKISTPRKTPFAKNTHNRTFQLWDTTLNPDTRRLLPVTLGEMSESDTIKTMDMLMGKAESGARRDWLEERGNEVEADI